MAAAVAKTHFGELLDAAQSGPVLITKKERPVAVLISQAEYERYEALEDAGLLEQARAAAARGEHLGAGETAEAMRKLLARADA